MSEFHLISTFISHLYLNITSRKKDGPREHQENTPKKGCLSTLVELFLFVWFIVGKLLPKFVPNATLFLLKMTVIYLIGNVWVYSVHRMVRYEPAYGQNYCNETLHLFSFWVITISWVFAGLHCCCHCCLFLVAGWWSKKPVVEWASRTQPA